MARYRLLVAVLLQCLALIWSGPAAAQSPSSAAAQPPPPPVATVRLLEHKEDEPLTRGQSEWPMADDRWLITSAGAWEAWRWGRFTCEYSCAHSAWLSLLPVCPSLLPAL